VKCVGRRNLHADSGPQKPPGESFFPASLDSREATPRCGHHGGPPGTGRVLWPAPGMLPPLGEWEGTQMKACTHSPGQGRAATPQKSAQLFPPRERPVLEGRLQRSHSQGPARFPPVLGWHLPALPTSDSATVPLSHPHHRLAPVSGQSTLWWTGSRPGAYSAPSRSGRPCDSPRPLRGLQAMMRPASKERPEAGAPGLGPPCPVSTNTQETDQNSPTSGLCVIKSSC
jgi:hypothetical protein